MSESENQKDDKNIVYHIHNTDTWASATKQFFKEFFGLAALLTIVLTFGHCLGCIDAPEAISKIVHGK